MSLRKLYEKVLRQTQSIHTLIQAGEQGADAGFVGFTTNPQMIEWFNKNKNLIEDSLNELAEAQGCDNYLEMLVNTRRKDMLDLGIDGIKVLASWSCLEHIGQTLYDRLEELKHYGEGITVYVYDDPDCENFTGEFVGFKEDDEELFVQVRDSEDNVWDVDLISVTIEG